MKQKLYKSSLQVIQLLENGEKLIYNFTSPFTIGRDPSCDMHQDNDRVSRYHAKVFHDETNWWIRDLKSKNGTFVNDQRIREYRICQESDILLGKNGVSLFMQPVPLKAGHSIYFDKFNALFQQIFRPKPISQHAPLKHVRTRAGVIAEAKQHSSWQRGFPSFLLVLLVIAVGFSIYQHSKLAKLHATTAGLFDAIKTLEIQIAQQEISARTGTLADRQLINNERKRLSELKYDYHKFLESINKDSIFSSRNKELIYRVARFYGEYEVEMPVSFIREVEAYIKKWQSKKMKRHLEQSIDLAKTKGYIPIIQKAMQRNHLPAQFFYLGVQESGFKLNAVGPATKHGIAKGPWQFIPKTAIHYGLKTGPLLNQRTYDPADERHNFSKSTYAAARYLKYIYSTDARASGLLVMAGYNWGEHRVGRLLRKMPGKPSQKNFWTLVSKNRIPSETYDYVLRIFSATVIGEDPKYFGFNFDNPLAES